MKAQLVEPGVWSWYSMCGDCSGGGIPIFLSRTGDCDRGGIPSSGHWEFVPP